jgi:ABC-2 type transport system permease protein
MTAIVSGTATDGPAAAPPMLRLLARQAAAQGRTFIRTPAVSVVSFAMPLILYLFFAVPNMGRPYLPGVDLGTFMLASFAAYAVSSVMLFNYGVTIAMDRGQRVDVLMRASPLPGSVYLLARTLTALALGLAGLAVLMIVAALTGAHLSPAVWLDMAARLLLGSLPFIGLGFALAYLCSPTAAPAVANMLFLVLAFGSGMLVRVDQMPDFLRAISPYLPTSHYAQLAWGAVGAASEDLTSAAAWLAGYAVVLFAVAAWAYRRESARRFA